MFKAESFSLFISPLETPFIILQSPKVSHVFTDLAYIQIYGDAGSTKRKVWRREYARCEISEVSFETVNINTGIMGKTDLDCTLSFSIGTQISIDISKEEQEHGLKLYRSFRISI